MDVIFAKVLTVIALLASLLSGAVFALVLTTAQGAPQEAAGSAMALFIVVAPYCAARLAWQWVDLPGGESETSEVEEFAEKL